MKSGADFDHGGHPAVHLHRSGARFCHSREEFENRAFARAVAADKADGLTLLDLEGNVLESPEILFQRMLCAQLQSVRAGWRKLIAFAILRTVVPVEWIE